MKRAPVVWLLVLTFGALLVHGYHPAAEDAEIYIPGIVKILHPSYYPFGQEFFEAHAHLTLYPNLMAWSVRLTHLSLRWVLFLWQIACIFLLLLACWRIAAKCFPTAEGRWGGVGLVAALLTLPVAGTSLYIFDQYLNPRCFSAFAVMFAIDAAMENNYWLAGLWLILTGVIQPLMTVFGLAFILLFFVMDRIKAPSAAAAIPIFSSLFPSHPSAAYWEALRAHRYYFLMRWKWYEWLGIVAPLGILWWLTRLARKKKRAEAERLTRATLVFGAIFFAAGLVVTIPKALEILTPYQPMRDLQLLYTLLFLIGGGWIGEFALRKHALRWTALLLPICAGMCYAQLQLFPGARHVEWPGAAPENPWLQSFVWIRENTPVNAIFALDPRYMAWPEEDAEGFRATAERSRLADALKDWSASAMFPSLPMADHCLEQVQAAKGWRNFGPSDFERLKKKYGVTWVVVQQPGGDGLPCPYQNGIVKVCRVN